MTQYKNTILVSIIMPNYNGAKYISQAIESVLTQTYSNFELIIVDDGSVDESIDIIKKYKEKDDRIKFFKTSHIKYTSGPTAARNTALDHAVGDYIAFLDSDDIWYPLKLEHQIDHMVSNNVDFLYCWYDIMLANGKIVGRHRPKTITMTYHSLLKNCEIGCLTVIYNKSKLGKQYINNTDPLGDFSLWLQILKVTPAVCLHETLASYRLSENSLSTNKLVAAKRFWYSLTKIEKIPLPRASYYFTCYVFISLTTKLKPLIYRIFSSNKKLY